MTRAVTILGGGAMGTACSILLAEQRIARVALWTRQPAQAEELARSRENTRLLPGIRLPDSIFITADIAAAVAQTELLVVAIPTAFLREALTALAPSIPAACPVVSVVKGLENSTFLRPSEIIRQTLGNRSVCALCGPSHAEEMGRRLPASVVAASDDATLAQHVQTLFTTDRFRVYTNRDLLGVELAGAIKNVIAIAAGICDGLNYGDNAKAALLTRGVVEMTRCGVSLGAEAETFAGLAGIGDLITTCYSRYGRNRGLGERLGRGLTLPQALKEFNGVVEGVTTARSVRDLAQSKGIEMPIAAEVYRVLFENKSPTAATDSLMTRPPRAEA